MVLAAIDATVVAAAGVTGATAVIVGWLGLFQSKLSASVARRQIEGEMERLVAATRKSTSRSARPCTTTSSTTSGSSRG